MRNSHLSTGSLIGFGLAAAVGLIWLPHVAAQTPEHWNGTTGTWTTAASWSGGVVPNNNAPPGSTYDAFLDAAGTYTVTLNTSVTVSDLILNAAGATLSISGETLNIVSNATLTAGTIQMNAGTISGGTFSTGGGVIQFNNSLSNVLNGVTLGSASVINLSAANSDVQLTGGTVLPAGTYALGASSAIFFNQTATTAGDFTLANGAALTAEGGNTASFSGSISVATANATATLLANRLGLTNGANSTFASTGTIGFAAGATNATLNVSTFNGGGFFTNAGTLQANTTGSTITVSIPFTNQAGGQVLVPTGGTVSLNGGLSNAGTFVVSGGILNLGGAFTTAQLGSLNHTAGTVNVTGTLTNTSATLALTDTGPTPTGAITLAAGTITGGSVTTAGSGTAQLLFNSSFSNVLNGVTLAAANVVNLSAANSIVQLTGGTVLPVGTYALGAGGVVLFNQTGSVPGAFTLGSGSFLTAEGGNTVTFGDSITVAAASTTATLLANRLGLTNGANSTFANASTGTIGFAAGATNATLNVSTFNGGGFFTNAGTLQANTTGSTITVSIPFTNQAGGQVLVPTGGTVSLNGGLSNAGTFVVSGGILNLGGAFTTAQLGSLNHTAGTVNVTGTLTNTSATLALTDTGPTPTGAITLAAGTITGGSVTTAGSGTAQLLFTQSLSNILNNVALGSASVINLSAANSIVQLTGGTMLPVGTYALGAGGVVLFNQTGSVPGAFTLGSGSFLTAEGGNTVTFGDSITVAAASTTATLLANRLGLTNGASSTFANASTGTIGFAAGATNATLNVSTFNGGGFFTNAGILQANTAGSTITVSIPFTNQAAGQVLVPTGGTVSLNGGLSNAGTFVVSGGILNLGGTFTTAQLGSLNHTAGTVNVTGTLTNTSATLALTDTGPTPTGAITLAAGTITGGSVTTAGSGTAQLLFNSSFSNVLNGVTLAAANVVNLSAANSIVQLTGGTMLPAGTYALGAGSVVLFNQTGSVPGAFTLGSGSFLTAEGGNTVTFGDSVSVATASTTATLLANRLGLTNGANSTFANASTSTIGFAAGATNATLNVSTFVGGGIFTNAGTLQANTAGSTITVSIPFTNQAGGQVLVPTGGTVSLNGGLSNAGTFVVSGGILNLGGAFTTAQLGSLNHTAGTVNLTGTLTNTSATLALNDTGMTPTGAITLAAGTITGGSVTTAGSGTAQLLFNSSFSNVLNGVTLAAANVINLSAANSIVQLTGGTVLPAGTYALGAGGVVLFNQTATTAASFTLGSGAFLTAEGGNTVTFGGSVSVAAASTTATLLANRLGLTNGANSTFANASTGTIGFATGATNATLNVSTFNGGGFFTNAGTLQANTAGSSVNIMIPTFTNSGTLSASGGGTISISNSTTTNFTNLDGNGGTLSGGTYNVGAGSTLTLGTRAVSTIGTGALVTLDGMSSTFTAVNSVVTNNGTFSLTGGRSFMVASPGTLTNSGTLTVGNTAATTLTGAVVDFSGGVVQGAGTITGTVMVNSGGTLHPGNSPGILTIMNTVTLASGANFAVDLNGATVGTTYSQLNLTGGGSINLGNATLVTSLGYAPAPGDSFTIITGGTVSGIFNGLTSGSMVPLGTFQGTPYSGYITYNSTSVVLTPVPEPMGILAACAEATGILSLWRRRRRSIADSVQDRC